MDRDTAFTTAAAASNTSTSGTRGSAAAATVVAGMDDIMSLLTELIVEPIKRRHEYLQYSTYCGLLYSVSCLCAGVDVLSVCLLYSVFCLCAGVDVLSGCLLY